jgi:hypothetical protein
MIYQTNNKRPASLQAFVCWWVLADLNRGPKDYEPDLIDYFITILARHHPHTIAKFVTFNDYDISNGLDRPAAVSRNDYPIE